MNHSFLFVKQYFSIATFIYFFSLLLSLYSPLAVAAESKGAGSFEIDEEASVRALEHSLIQAGSLLLGTGKLDFQIGFGFNRTENDILLFSSTNNSIVGQTKNTLNRITMPISIRAGLPYDAQIGLSIPLLYVDQQSIQTVGNNIPLDISSDGSGIGDINLTLSKTLGREKNWKPDVIGFISWDADNGKRSDNGVLLSSGFNEFKGGFTLTKSQDPLVFSTTFSAQIAAKKDNVKLGNQYALSLNTFLAASPSTSLKFSIDQIFSEKIEINNKEVIDSDRTIALLNIGISSVISPNTFLSLSTGAGLTDDSPNYTFNVSLSTRVNYSPLKAASFQKINR